MKSILYVFVMLIISATLSSCTIEGPTVESEITYQGYASNDNYQYTIKLTSNDDACNYRDIEVTVDIKISSLSAIEPGTTLRVKHSFGELGGGKTEEKTFKTPLGNRTPENNAASISDVSTKQNLPLDCFLIRDILP